MLFLQDFGVLVIGLNQFYVETELEHELANLLGKTKTNNHLSIPTSIYFY